MNTDQTQMQQRAYALIAGCSLIVMALAAAFSYGYVHGNLVVVDNAKATLANMMSARGLFKSGLFGWLIILLCDIACTWSLYMYMKSINKSLSLLGAWLRLSYTMILAIAVAKLIEVSLLLDSPSHAALWTTDQLQAKVMLELSAFEAIWSLGLIVFGGHLLVVALVAFQAGFIPKMISILVLIAAISYVITHIDSSFLSQSQALEAILIAPMTIGELAFGLWLLFRGGKQR